MAATFAFGSSPSTSPPLFSRRDTITSRCSVNPQEKDARVPRLLKFAVGGATEFLRLLSPSNKNKRNDWTSEEVCVVRSVDEVVEMLRLDYNKAYFLTGKFTPGLYAEDCLFEDPTIKFRGKDRYSQNLDLLVPFLDQPSLTLEKIEKEMDYNMDSIIIAEWKLRTYLKFPWRPLISINGSTIYRLDKDFKIIMHSESWSVSALEAVGQLFSSGIKNNASASPLFREFWFRKAFHVLNVTRLNTTISFDCSKLVVSKTCRTLIIKDIIPARASMKGEKKKV